MERLVCNVVWLKKDLRLYDHAPLKAAAEAGLPTLVLLFFEPSTMGLKVSDVRHWRFLYECYADLDRRLRPYGHRICLVHGEVLSAFEALRERLDVKTVFSYQETNLQHTFARDKAFKRWTKRQGIAWQEFQQNGVVRGLRDRSCWAERWETYMLSRQDSFDIKRLKPLDVAGEWLDCLQGPPLPEAVTTPDTYFQKGGETLATETLESFLDSRFVYYAKHVAKPEFCRRSCSRLSPYLTHGCLSVRQAYQAATLKMNEVAHSMRLLQQLEGFRSRLRWHCHYIQKYEMEIRIEKENFNRGYDLLDWGYDEKLFEAWRTGQTGFPMVDASMRCLNATGYLNFRMRAMLASFLSHGLWLYWKHGSNHMAQQFLDFEPGIHYPQWQMQAGTVGTHVIRVYNPVKQAQDHDPEGHFIRKWVPELTHVPAPYVYDPGSMTPMEQAFYKCRPGVDYAAPVVDFERNAKHARDTLAKMQQEPLVNVEKFRITKKHSIPREEQIVL